MSVAALATDAQRDAAVRIGQLVARQQFKKRERNGQTRVEIHLSEGDLAAIVALGICIVLGGQSKAVSLRGVNPRELDHSELLQFADRLERTAELCDWALKRHGRGNAGAMRAVIGAAAFKCNQWAAICRGPYVPTNPRLPKTDDLNAICSGLRSIGEKFGESEAA